MPSTNGHPVEHADAVRWYFAASGSCRNSQEFRSPPYPCTSRITSPSAPAPLVQEPAAARPDTGAPAAPPTAPQGKP